MGRAVALGVLAAVLAAAPGCDPASPPDPSGRASQRREVESNDHTYVVSYETHPDPIHLNEPFTLQFEVRPRVPSAAPKGELGVEVDARMPAHFHGMTRVPRISRRSDGRFVAEGMLFHMPGRWEVYVDIARGAKVERAQWQVDLK